MVKKKTYGFANKKHVEDLIASIGGGDTTYIEGRTRGGGGKCVHFKTGASAIAGSNTTTGNMSSQSCAIYTSDTSGALTSASESRAVYNASSRAFPANTFGIAWINDAGLLVTQPVGSLFDVRVKPDGSALQKSTDGGATWTDWASIGACT